MAKIKAALKALDRVLDDLPAHIEKLRDKSGLKVVELDLEFSGSIDIDRDGGLDLGGEASADAVSIAAGVPLAIKASVGSKWANQGAADWKLRVRFG